MDRHLAGREGELADERGGGRAGMPLMLAAHHLLQGALAHRGCDRLLGVGHKVIHNLDGHVGPNVVQDLPRPRVLRGAAVYIHDDTVPPDAKRASPRSGRHGLTVESCAPQRNECSQPHSHIEMSAVSHTHHNSRRRPLCRQQVHPRRVLWALHVGGEACRHHGRGGAACVGVVRGWVDRVHTLSYTNRSGRGARVPWRACWQAGRQRAAQVPLQNHAHSAQTCTPCTPATHKRMFISFHPYPQHTYNGTTARVLTLGPAKHQLLVILWILWVDGLARLGKHEVHVQGAVVLDGLRVVQQAHRASVPGAGTPRAGRQASVPAHRQARGCQAVLYHTLPPAGSLPLAP